MGMFRTSRVPQHFSFSLLMGICFASPTRAEPIATADGEAPGTSLQVQELKVSNGP
jgi:hypothetical protein